MLKLKPFELADAKLIERLESLGQAEDATIASNYYLEVSAAIRPPGNPSPPGVPVPRGYGIYFSRTYNNGWTDNRDAGARPLEGFSFEENNEYIPSARRAQLVTVCDNQWFIGYEKSIDWGLGNRNYVVNDTNGDWFLRWYMNDSMNANNSGNWFYSDNGGTANIDLVVFRL